MIRLVLQHTSTLVSALFFFQCFSLIAQSPPLEPLKSIDEVWRKDMNIPVSGEIRTGLVYDISGDNYVQEYFYVNLPKEKSDVLFVEITSNDGRYNATLSFDVKNQSPGPLKLKWNTEFYNDLKEFSYKELTILSWMGNANTPDQKDFVISNWSSFNSEEFIYIILNSEQQSFINIYDPTTNNTANFKCEQFTDQVKVSFCSFCKIPIESIKAKSEIAVIQRARKSFNRYPMNLKF